MTNTIINIAYCEGKSRAPSALYRFCERNLFKIIDPDVIKEIYADSEYTGENQLVYLTVRSESDITMCLKQNPKIKRWKEETIQRPEDWECVLSTIRTSIFSNQNCELSLDDSGDLLITYLDGDRQGIKKRLAELLTKRKEAGLNRVSWWGNRGVQIQIKDQYAF
jgi:hypothetical protein